MGQKTNPNIFRIGLQQNSWNSKYLAKKLDESSIYLFNDLEIKKYLDTFFKKYGLIIHSYKLQHIGNKLFISISYVITLKGIRFVNFSRKNLSQISKNSLNNFVEIILESLSIFTRRIPLILLTLQNLNKCLFLNFKKDYLKILKTKKLQLRKFSKKPFFSETLAISIIVMNFKKSSKLLSELIVLQLKRLKKQTLFILFLKQILFLFAKSQISRVKGIKVIIYGRFNNLPRSSSKKILIGKIPLQTIGAKIDYFQNTLFTLSGTFGINVWIF